MTKKRTREFTEAEFDAARLACLRAAKAILDDINFDSEETEERALTLRVIQAFSVSRKTEQAIEAEFKREHRISDFGPALFIDHHRIVASALAFPDDDPEDVSPYARGGLPLLYFAKASYVLASWSSLDAVLDDGELFGVPDADAVLAVFATEESSPKAPPQ